MTTFLFSLGLTRLATSSGGSFLKILRKILISLVYKKKVNGNLRSWFNKKGIRSPLGRWWFRISAQHQVLTKDSYCCYCRCSTLTLRVGGIPWPKIGTIYYHTKLLFQTKVVKSKSWLSVGCYQSNFQIVWTEKERMVPLNYPWLLDLALKCCGRYPRLIGMLLKFPII